MTFTQITVTRDYDNPDGTDPAGYVLFQPTSPMVNDGVTVVATVKRADLDVDGLISIDLAANTDPDTTPTGTAYYVTERITGQDVRSYYVVIPHDAAGGKVDLSELDTLDTAPPTAAALAQHIADPDPHPGIGMTPEQVRDVMAAALVAGSGVTITPDDVADTITITATFDAEVARDTLGTALVEGSGIDITVDDTANTITIAATFDAEAARDAIGTALVAGTGVTITPNDGADTITIGLDSDLATIAGLTATTDSFLQAKAGAWAARTIAQVRADLAPPDTIPVRYVATTGSDSNDGTAPETAFRTIQAAIDDLPSSGGTIYVLPHGTDSYSPFSSSKPNLVIEGLGGVGQDTQVGTGLCRIAVGAGETGASLCVGAGSHVFRGPVLRNLHFVGSASAVAGIEMGNCSNFLVENCATSDFTAASGKGIYISGSNAAQYGTIRDHKSCDSKIGIHVADHGCLRIFGGFIEYLPSGSSITAGTTGVLVDSSADVRVWGLLTQFLETCYDISGDGTQLHGIRCEAFTTGVKFRGSAGLLGPGASFNNFIVGGGGQCVDVTATATKTVINRFYYGSVAAIVVADAGTNTLRGDAVRVDKILASTISATTNEVVFFVPSYVGEAPDGYKLRYCTFQPGETAIAASGTNYWSVTIKRRGTGSNDMQTIDSQAGWAAYDRKTIDVTGAGGTDPTFVAGDRIHVTLTKTGSPSNLSNATLHLLLVPR